jgi:serine/threonine protein kinase
MLDRLVAVKKIGNAFANLEETKRTYREIVLMRNLQHDAVQSILNVFSSPGAEFDDIYMVTDLMETDLRRIIVSQQQLSVNHVQWITYQLFCGLKYLHSANILHRDLKPENILINSDTGIRICDFGLARVQNDNEAFMTLYVATRWYRAPEVILSWKEYSKAIDVWSGGCVVAELINNRPLFPGQNYMHQVNTICDIVGTPSPEELENIPNQVAANYVRSLGKIPHQPFQKLYPKAPPELCNFLDSTLVFNPAQRLTAAQAIEHPFCQAGFRDAEMEEDANTVFNFDFEMQSPSAAAYRALINREIAAAQERALELDLSGSGLYSSGGGEAEQMKM